MADRLSPDDIPAGHRPRSRTSASNVVDFGSPSPMRTRSQTTPLSPSPGPPSSGRSGLQRERRGSNLSRISSNGSVRRRPTRTNTVRTYNAGGERHVSPGPGAEPGIDLSHGHDEDPPHLQALRTDCDIKIVDFSVDNVLLTHATNETLAGFLDEPRPEDLPCRWISVNGLSWDVIKCLGRKFDLHRLAIEDLIQTHSRTKVDWYKDNAFIILTLQKLVRLHQNGEHHDCPASDYYDRKHSFEGHRHHHHSQGGRWWKPNGLSEKEVLPRFLDRDGDGKIDETIRAHSGLSEDSPIREIRTLHRYESSQIPEHTAFMEKHSALAKEDMVVSVEQVSIFLTSENTVISFFEHSAEDIEGPILERLQSTETILRRTTDASLLTQAIIDAIVDLAFPVVHAYNNARKELQVQAMTYPNIKTSRALHIFGEEIDSLQNLVKPLVHLLNALRDHNTDPLPSALEQSALPDIQTTGPSPDKFPPQTKRARDGEAMTRKTSDFRRVPLKRAQTVTTVSITPIAHVYFGDVLDHCITIIQAFEQMDASANNISTLIFNTVGAKTNNTMMILALVTIIFAPLTFISGYFGMNFASGNGLKHPFAFFWVVAIPSLGGFMLLVFLTMMWDVVAGGLSRMGFTIHQRRRGKRRYA